LQELSNVAQVFLGNDTWTFHFITYVIWFTCQSYNTSKCEKQI